jgi:hypothetical protein
MTDDEVLAIDFSGWPVPESYLVEVGRLTVLWANLESLLNLCISKLAGFDDLADMTPVILLTHMSYPQRLDILAALCGELQARYPWLQGHAAVVTRLRNAQQSRNKFAHHGMSIDPDTGVMQMGSASARGKLKTSVETVKLADIRRATMEIHMAHLDLYALVLKKRYPPMWERPKERGRPPEEE